MSNLYPCQDAFKEIDRLNDIIKSLTGGKKMRHLEEFEQWTKIAYQVTPLSLSEIGLMKEAFDEGWKQGQKNSKKPDSSINLGDKK